MRRLDSVLRRRKTTKNPPRQFVAHLLGLMRMLPGHAPLRPLSRDRPDPERTLARWDDTDWDWGALHQTALTEGVPFEPDQAWGIDARVVPTRGQYPDGLAGFWTGRHRRTDTGRDISTVAWLARTAHGASGLRVEQTLPSPAPAAPEATRLDVSLDHLRRVGTAHAVCVRRDVVTAGADRQPPGVAGGLDVGRPQMGQWRAEATRRELSQAPKRRGPGRQQTDDGHVPGNA